MRARLLRGAERVELLRLLGLECLQAFGFGHDLLAHRGQFHELLAYDTDALGTGAPEVAVPGQHATDLRRVLLVEQQLELLLAPVDVGGAQLAGQGVPLHRELRLAFCALVLQLAQLGLALQPCLRGRRRDPCAPAGR